MKIFEAKTIDEAVKNASEEMNIPIANIHYIVKEKRNNDNIFDSEKFVKIEIYSMNDVCTFAINYLKNAISKLGINIEIISQINNDIINLTVDNEKKNSILIGKKGVTLKAFNTLLRLAVSNKFKKRHHILLDIGHYKDKRYIQIIDITKSIAKIVDKQHINVRLDPMTSDERRVVHQTLLSFNNLTAESIGNGEKRVMIIKYNDNGNDNFIHDEVYYKDILRREQQFNNQNEYNNIDQIKQEKIKFNDYFDNLTYKDADLLKSSADKSLNNVDSNFENNKNNEGNNDIPSAVVNSNSFIDNSTLKDLKTADNDYKKND